MDDRETFVKIALSDFLRNHSAQGSISAIDEIVLNYMVSILEDLGSESTPEDAFDPEEFKEMMEAYLPGFGDINSIDVSEWMFHLARTLEQLKNERKKGSETKSTGEISLKIPANLSEVRQTKRSHSISEKEPEPVQSKNGITITTEEASEEMMILMEMFPLACSLEITHCLCLSNGDTEKAAQLILLRQETGECIKNSPRQVNATKGDTPRKQEQLKQTILEKYSYLDTEDDKREHRPVAPKKEPKKLVRYLDNKVVSTKGERFTEIKKNEDEDMKKTYVNIKPAKQYRFH